MRAASESRQGNWRRRGYLIMFVLCLFISTQSKGTRFISWLLFFFYLFLISSVSALVKPCAVTLLPLWKKVSVE